MFILGLAIPKKTYIDNDICHIKGSIMDSGDGKIKGKFYRKFNDNA